MTNNPMLSVERELLVEMLAAMKETHSLPAKFYGSTLGDRVRALIDSRNDQDQPLPIGTLHRGCDERIVFESSDEIHIKDGMQVYTNPAAQPQGEPMPPTPRKLEIAMEALNYIQHFMCDDTEGDAWHLAGHAQAACELIEQTREAEQPAPVAEVLPEKLTDAEVEELEVIEVLLHGQGLSNLAGTMAAARQFIGEAARLNAVKP